MEGAREYWKKRDRRMAMVRRRTERLRPVEWGERDPRHVLQMEDAVLQQQYAAASWRVDAIAPMMN
jgi:hypothetical protein